MEEQNKYCFKLPDDFSEIDAKLKLALLVKKCCVSSHHVRLILCTCHRQKARVALSETVNRGFFTENRRYFTPKYPLSVISAMLQKI